ncbi:MAG: hypothetical protein GX663_07620 [Clostridiales bacterium]|nr:hypothetical protein [Clostridiales bacterium]
MILQLYNEEFRGLLNYYNLAVDYNYLGYFRYLMEYSCLATLAGKHNSSISKIAKQYRRGKCWSVAYITSMGIEREIRLATLKDCQKGDCNDNIIKHRYIPAINSSIQAILASGICELCGKKT